MDICGGSKRKQDYHERDTDWLKRYEEKEKAKCERDKKNGEIMKIEKIFYSEEQPLEPKIPIKDIQKKSIRHNKLILRRKNIQKNLKAIFSFSNKFPNCEACSNPTPPTTTQTTLNITPSSIMNQLSPKAQKNPKTSIKPKNPEKP